MQTRIFDLFILRIKCFGGEGLNCSKRQMAVGQCSLICLTCQKMFHGGHIWEVHHCDKVGIGFPHQCFEALIVSTNFYTCAMQQRDYRSYNALDVSGFHHHRINHSTHFAEQKTNHINGIKNFWSQAKRVLRKYNGIPKQHFHLFLKECELRFNYGSPKEQLIMLKKWCF